MVRDPERKLAMKGKCLNSSFPMDGKKVLRVLIAESGYSVNEVEILGVARSFSDAGYEVIYLGGPLTSEQVATAAVQEDVDLIGLNFISGEDTSFCRQVVTLLQKNEADDVILVRGDFSTAEQLLKLREAGTKGPSVSRNLVKDALCGAGTNGNHWKAETVATEPAILSTPLNNGHNRETMGTYYDATLVW